MSDRKHGLGLAHRGKTRVIGWLAGWTFLGLALAAMGQVPPAAAPAEPPKSAWQKSASLGLTLTDGNSESLLFTAQADALKKWEKNEFVAGASVTYGEADDEKNNEQAKAYSQYNRLFTDKWFGYVRGDALHDAIADIEYRFTIGPGLGYYFFKNAKTYLSGEIGPSFVYEKVGSETSRYFTIRFAERYEIKLNEKTRIWESAEVLPQVDDWNNFIANIEVGIETELTRKVSLRVYLQDTYDNEPAPDREENDVKVVTALAMKF